ncbi:DUF4124 domain-containing protein [Ectothiorhodospiraceae bacterium WFHF3C12]|nr:DUF4124 domain-containing protein [Ectothiorhodospiraceae bacterium WFHF3C12]
MTDRRSRPSRFVIALVLLAIALPATAKIYKWTDEQGNIHYGDEPPEGAETIDLPPATVYESPGQPSPRRSGTADTEGADAPAYERVAITSPGQEATIRGVEQTITVRVTAQPELRRGHTVEILYDGETAARGERLEFAIGPVYRGTHTITAVVRDAAGRELERSETITFYKHQPTVN